MGINKDVHTSIRAGGGVSFQYKNMWYKLYYEEEDTLDGDVSEEMKMAARKRLWEAVDDEIASQVHVIMMEDGN